MSQAHGIRIKKKFGQHFLRDERVVQQMCERVSLAPQSSVFEIGCGDGVLTREILRHPLARLWVFEIDPEWASFVSKQISDKRLKMFQENILDVDFERFKENAPWILLANLPYQITFPLLHRFQQHAHLLQEGVIMVQEEVAQKIVQEGGRGYGYISLFFQYHFEWELLAKVPPTAFQPPPKIYSRLMYFKPKKNLKPIPHEAEFWRFIKACFSQPRRTLRNNLLTYHYPLDKIPEKTLLLRSQQMDMEQFLSIWEIVRK